MRPTIRSSVMESCVFPFSLHSEGIQVKMYKVLGRTLLLHIWQTVSGFLHGNEKTQSVTRIGVWR